MRSLLQSPAPTTRHTVCHHCRQPLELPAAAQTATCPACYKPLVLHDLEVTRSRFGGSLATCARLIVRQRASVRCQSVIAVLGVEVLGELEADVVSLGPVVIGAKGVLRGTLAAPRLHVEPGGAIEVARLTLGAPAETPTA